MTTNPCIITSITPLLGRTPRYVYAPSYPGYALVLRICPRYSRTLVPRIYPCTPVLQIHILDMYLYTYIYVLSYPGYLFVPRICPRTPDMSSYPGYVLVPRICPRTPDMSSYPGYFLVPRIYVIRMGV